ncbi:amino acid ABC transporter substrate-binding protein [Methylobacterium persicinum]|uniref:Glutamate/aspartate transport system substrate-binding protein n=1 Tax=Methylobacterium persicinum TaxID=374426 RepID=A0ABU0HKQ1_9HYPH|nr:amino acid ABC transporter substrate-binding protein [Methylobacterium persicinum]MDQ0442893.1 glutamate/aspartate transport system substrate-binding protein [Methylobacterium persicinum]GJE37359.1 Glutamate/aspartate import solute-binding protein [Methylobacterium persicinum]
MSLRIVCLVALTLAATGPAAAVEVLTGTLKTAAERGEIVIGYRDSAIPFSFVEGKGADGSPRVVGYAIDLCSEIADDLQKAVGRPLKVRYEPVTAESRIQAVASGKVDLECGSTTANAERRKQVAFSPVDFISATKLLVRKGSPISSYRDLGGRTIVVTAGTTNDRILRDLLARLKIDAQVVTAPDHAGSFAMVKAGKADAFATDDILLYGLIASDAADGSSYTVLPDKLSYEPYGIVFRRDDPEMTALVANTFTRLAETRELRWIYERWFLKRLPNGERLDVRMSDDLRVSFQLMGLDAGE